MTCPDVSICLCSERVVALDIRNDRYFMLPPNDETAFKAWLAGAAPSPHQLRAMQALGLTMRVDGELRPIAPFSIDIPAKNSPLASPGAHFSAWAKAFCTLAYTSLSLRFRSFRDNILISNTSRAALTDLQIETSASLFTCVRPYLPSKPICLKDSLALYRFIGAASGQVHLVLGVKLDPFAAHCWLQTDRCLLNEKPDHASQFTPIFAVS